MLLIAILLIAIFLIADHTQQHCYFADSYFVDVGFELHPPISNVAMLGCYRAVVNQCARGCLYSSFIFLDFFHFVLCAA